MIIKQKDLYQNLGFTEDEWDEIADPLLNTRNSIAHPVKYIIREKNDFKRVLDCLKATKKINSKLYKAKLKK